MRGFRHALRREVVKGVTLRVVRRVWKIEQRGQVSVAAAKGGPCSLNASRYAVPPLL